MREHRFKLFRTLFIATVLTAPTFTSAGQTAAIPDFSGIWGRNWFQFEPKPGSPIPVGAKVLHADGTMQLVPNVGDDRNPLLTARAAEALRKRNEISMNDAAPDPHNQCRPEPTPFTLATQFGVQIFQQKNEVLIVSVADQSVRHIRMNASHPAHLVPTWQGDSVGHYEGGVLVIDTIGQKTGALAVVDLYGTPFSEKLHVTERYRLIDGAAARDAQQQNEARYFPPGVSSPLTNEYGRGNIDPDSSKPGLQVEVTVEDPEMFTKPWSGYVTYRHVLGDWPEAICAENTHEFYANRETAVPQAATPDF